MFVDANAHIYPPGGGAATHRRLVTEQQAWKTCHCYLEWIRDNWAHFHARIPGMCRDAMLFFLTFHGNFG